MFTRHENSIQQAQKEQPQLTNPIENKENIPYNLPLLKNYLLNGQLTFAEVRNVLRKADQATPDRKASITNVDFLLDPEIANFLSKGEDQEAYYLFTSFSLFHKAQIAAQENQNIQLVQGIMTKALSYKLKCSDPRIDTNYLKGTIAYLSGDLQSLENCAKRLLIIAKEIPQELPNCNILKNLIHGLKNYGTPDYARDYFGEKKKG